MPQSYTPEFKKKIVRLHEEEGRTYVKPVSPFSPLGPVKVPLFSFS